MVFEKFIKKEVNEEEEEEEEETDEEIDEGEEEKEWEEESEESKVVSIEEKWKLQHTEEWKTELVGKLGKLLADVVHYDCDL